jgi:superfamily II DNA helicase RecQ
VRKISLYPDTFHLLIAPPAWGKTQMLNSFLEGDYTLIIYISPLRALAEEVKNFFKPPPHVIFKVLLPEEILTLDWLAVSLDYPQHLVIWDELHLVWYWGESFRENMMEAWWNFLSIPLTSIGLSATFSPDCERKLLHDLTQAGYSFLIMGSAGNFSYKKRPKFFYLNHTSLVDLLSDSIEDLPAPGLIFCETRREVDEWAQKFAVLSLSILTCKGGQTMAFSQKLESYTKQKAEPKLWIIATSCLSHGVNLPSLKTVMVLGKKTPSYLIHQMGTRGGRRGDDYDLYLSQRGLLNFKTFCLAWIRGQKRSLMLRLKHLW